MGQSPRQILNNLRGPLQDLAVYSKAKIVSARGSKPVQRVMFDFCRLAWITLCLPHLLAK